MCISPVTSIMMDQTSKYSPKGLSTEFVGGESCGESLATRDYSFLAI